MLDDIFVGQIHPTINMKSVVSGKVFGPTSQQKTGYQVILTRDRKRTVFPVANKQEVDQVVSKAREAEKLLEEQDG